jgi:hypothetical protein
MKYSEGPLLVLIYIKSLDDNTSHRILKFADNTNMLGKIDDSEDAENLQDCLIQWSDNV